MNTIPPASLTEAETFILESLTLDDERNKRLDGQILFDMLKLQGKKPVYYYFRTQRELIELSKEFRASGYRYLHLSCHGNDDALAFTFGSITFEEFADIFDKKLHNRRLFISGCSLGNRKFADLLFAKNGGMYSVIAPTKRIFFDQASVFWSAFYFLMHQHSSKEMKKAQLEKALSKLSDLFGVSVAYYFRNTAKQAIVDEVIFKGGDAMFPETKSEVDTAPVAVVKRFASNLLSFGSKR
ncbi:MAG TPA: hypothetical protein VF651_09115 [Gammaproteobacteria bacterium]